MDEKINTQTNLKLRGKNTQKSPVRLLILKLKKWIPFRAYFCLDSVSAFFLSLLTENKERLWKLPSPHQSPHISTQRKEYSHSLYHQPLVTTQQNRSNQSLPHCFSQSPNILPCLYYLLSPSLSLSPLLTTCPHSLKLKLRTLRSSALLGL